MAEADETCIVSLVRCTSQRLTAPACNARTLRTVRLATQVTVWSVEDSEWRNDFSAARTFVRWHTGCCHVCSENACRIRTGGQ